VRRDAGIETPVDVNNRGFPLVASLGRQPPHSSEVYVAIDERWLSNPRSSRRWQPALKRFFGRGFAKPQIAAPCSSSVLTVTEDNVTAAKPAGAARGLSSSVLLAADTNTASKAV
jgi:hypothetical protein